MSFAKLRWVAQVYRGIYHRVPVWAILLAVAGTIAAWLTDVHHVLIVFGQAESTNGFFSLSANKGYHIGLYVSPIVIWILAVFRR